MNTRTKIVSIGLSNHSEETILFSIFIKKLNKTAEYQDI